MNETDTLDRIHRQLIDASQDIGGICETASWASSELAEEITRRGITDIDEMTVGALRALRDRQIERCSATR